MATTTNNKLFKYTNDNDYGDLKLLADTMDTIDKGISLKYPATLTAENTYTVTTGLSKTSLYNDYSLKVKIPSSSSGAVKIIIDSCSAVPVMKATSSGLAAVKNFKAKGIYELVYEDGNFLCASGDNLEEVTVTSDKLLTGYSANDSNGEKVNGTMANNGTKTATMALNSTITLPKGYYDGIKITQNVTTQGAITPGKSIVQFEDKVYCRILRGAYFTNATSGYPEISYPQGDVATALGLTANKIVAGNTICGVTGTATADRLLLIKSGTAIIAGSGVTISGSTFTNTDNYLIFSYCVDNNTHYISLFTKPTSSSEIIILYQISNNKNSIDRQEKDGVYFYWYKDNLIYNRGNASLWDGKTFKYKIYKITEMINF